MNFSLQIFFFFLHATYSLPRDHLIPVNLFRDNYPYQLNVIIKHCDEEYRFYKQLRIISVNQDLSFEFYRIVNEDYGIPIEVFNDANGLNSVSWQSCVLLCLSVKDLNTFLQSVDKYLWIPTNIYVIHTSDESTMIDETKNISLQHIWSLSAAELWENKLVHKFVLSTNKSSLFFDPFVSSENKKNPTNRNILKTSTRPQISFGAPRNLGNSVQLLTKRRNTFGGYEINVALFSYLTVKKDDDVWSGLDANAMQEICKRMNVTHEIFEPPETFGWFENGKFTGTLGRLVDHKSDLTFNGFFIKDYGPKEIEFSTFLLTDQICVIVPKRPRIPEYLLIARIFSFYSWVLILVGNSFVAVTYVGMTSVNFWTPKSPGTCQARGRPKLVKSFKNSSSRVKGSRTLTRVQRFMITSILFLLHPMKTNAKRFGERIHVAFGLMLGIVVGGCFTSQLASSFSKPAFLKNINTLRELDDSGLDILTSFPNLLNDVFADNESSTFRNLQGKLRLKNVSEIETQIFQTKNAGYLDRKHTVILAGNSIDTLHVISDYPREYYLAYPIVRGSPFLPRLNQIIGRLHNGGFYTKWLKDMKKASKNEETSKPVVIRLPHLYIPFFILLVGLVIAGGIFCFELNPPSTMIT